MTEQAGGKKKKNRGIKKKGKGKEKSEYNDSSTRYCELCKETVRIGTGGEGNWALHESGTKHRQLLYASKLPNNKQSKIGSFFTRVPTPAAPAAAQASSSAGPFNVPCSQPLSLLLPSSSPADEAAAGPLNDSGSGANAPPVIPDGRELPPVESTSEASLHTSVSANVPMVPETTLITRLRSASSRLPPTVPLATADDALAVFNADPRPAALSAEEGASGMVHDALKLFWGKEPTELQAFIRRGPLGVDALAEWLTICFTELHVESALVEGKVTRLIDAIELMCPPQSSPDAADGDYSDTIEMEMAGFGGGDLEVPLCNDDVVEYMPDEHNQIQFKSTIDRRATASSACRGYEFKPHGGQPAAEAYPWGLHTKQRPWKAEIDGNTVTLHSHACTGRARMSHNSTFPSPCLECAALHNTDAIMGARHRNASSVHDNTPRQYLTLAQLKELLEKKTRENDGFRFSKLTLERTLSSRDQHLDAFKRFVVLLGQDNVPRLHALVAAELRHGSSVFVLLEKLIRARKASLKTYSYSRTEFEQLFLIWKLGGYAAGNIAHRVLGLPSPDATRRFICISPLRPSAGAPTSSELDANIRTCFPESKESETSEGIRIGVTMPTDELKLQPRMRWDSFGNLILGICREHGDLCCLEFASESEGDAVVAALREGRLHLAVEATVIGVVVLTENPSEYSVRPFAVSGSCQRETIEQHVKLLKRAIAALRKRLEPFKRRLYSIASDGDARRRRAFYQIALYRTLTPTDDTTSIYPLLAPLPLFSLRCGDDDLTMDFDTAHIKKRFRGGVLRVSGVTINGVTVTPAVIKQHLVQNGMSTLTANNLLAPEDRQDVMLMFRLLNAISKLPESSPGDSQSSRASRNVLCLLGRIYAHLLKAYKDVSLSLHQQFVHLSALAHLLLGVYSKDKGNFIPVQLYTDTMHMVVNAFFALAKTQRDNPKGKFWLILMGTDGLEKVFGKVRSMIGNDSSADLLQLANRVDAAVKCVQILEEHPTWGGQSRRLNIPSMEETSDDHATKAFDHVNPRSWKGDVHVANVRCLTAWRAGRDVAERELSTAGLPVPFDDMEKATGFDVLCPSGGNKVVLANDELTAGEVDEVEDDEEQPRAAPSDSTPVYGPLGTSESIAPDMDDVAGVHETAAQAASVASQQKGGHSQTINIRGKAIHKSSWCRHYSQHFASDDSKDRLRRVRGHTQYDAKKTLLDLAPSTSSDPPADLSSDRFLSIEDPVLTLVCCDDLVFLALARVLDIRVSGDTPGRLAAERLHEPNVRLGVQIMVLSSVDDDHQPGKPDWEWTGRCITQTTSLRSIEGACVDPIDPIWTQSVRDTTGEEQTYAFTSSELRLFSAKLFSRLGTNTVRLPAVTQTAEFPYRLKDGSACFVCEDDVGALARHRDSAQYCPLRRCNKVFIPGLTGPDLIRHMSAHILHEPSYRDADSPCAFCLSIGGTCSIRFRPGKVKQIDLKNSRCPHLRGITFSKAEKYSERSPCTNVPVRCPLCPGHCNAVWKYNLRAHILKTHPGATPDLYLRHFTITEDERTLMKKANNLRPRQSRKRSRKLRLKVSHEHSSRFAFSKSMSPSATPGSMPSESEDEELKENHRSSTSDSENDDMDEYGDDDDGQDGQESVDEAYESHTLQLNMLEDQHADMSRETSAATSPQEELDRKSTSPDIRSTVTHPDIEQCHSDLKKPCATTPAVERAQTAPMPPSPDSTIVRASTAMDPLRAEQSLGRQLRSSGGQKRKSVPQDTGESADSDLTVCADCDGTVTNDDTLLTCDSPGCGLKYHLSCRGEVRRPSVDWFCDDECKGNAGLRTRRAKRRKV